LWLIYARVCAPCSLAATSGAPSTGRYPELVACDDPVGAYIQHSDTVRHATRWDAGHAILSSWHHVVSEIIPQIEFSFLPVNCSHGLVLPVTVDSGWKLTLDTQKLTHRINSELKFESSLRTSRIVVGHLDLPIITFDVGHTSLSIGSRASFAWLTSVLVYRRIFSSTDPYI
jgi:hypothetical protein